MTTEDRDHISAITAWFDDTVAVKYANGVKEHGGHLPDKGGVFAEAENEVLDMAVYLRTLRGQLEGVLALLQAHRPDAAEYNLKAILFGDMARRLRK